MHRSKVAVLISYIHENIAAVGYLSITDSSIAAGSANSLIYTEAKLV